MSIRSVAHRYAVAIVILALAFPAEYAFRSLIAPVPRLIYVGAVAVAAWYGGVRPGLLTAGLSAVILWREDILSGQPVNATEFALLAAYLAIAGLIIYLNACRARSNINAAATDGSEVIHLSNYLREKRRNSGADLAGTDRRGPLVLVYDLRSHFALARLTATELETYIAASDEAKQVYAYLRWAHEQIEHDIASLDEALKPSNHEESSATGGDTWSSE
jgi:hypothetical protein